MRVRSVRAERRGILVLVLLLLAGGSPSLAQEKKLRIKDLPSAVKSAFRQAYPKAKITGAGSEKEKGTIYYEIESLEGRTKRDLLYTATGQIVEVEEAVSMDDVPAVVKTTLEKEFPKPVISKSERVIKGGILRYEFQVKVVKGVKEVVIDSAGTIIKGKPDGDENSGKEGEEEDDDD